MPLVVYSSRIRLFASLKPKQKRNGLELSRKLRFLILGAFYRFLEEETKKQKNMEDITQKALPALNDDSTPEELEDDWVTNFFDKCRLVSDDEMQSLWSRVLAGEANSPGTFSKRTVTLLSDLDKGDAELFTRLCGFAWKLGGVVPLILDYQHDIYTEHAINFGVLSHLESIGLIHFNSAGPGEFGRLRLPKTFSIFYYGSPVVLEMPKEADNELAIGRVLLTKVGEELAPICGSKPVAGFFEYVLEKWRVSGYVKEATTEQSDIPTGRAAEGSVNTQIDFEGNPPGLIE
jgi:Protein of unknown function (DUF2806)